MNELEELQQYTAMIGNSISDGEFCKHDLDNIEKAFVTQYPDYSNPEITQFSREIFEQIKVDYIQFRRRNYIRAVFSNVEGILFAMKRTLLNHKDRLSDNEIIKLQEYKLIGACPDKLSKQLIRISISENIKLVFKIFSKHKGTEGTNTFSDSCWLNFKEAIGIRNRITHPKISEDLVISDKELECIKNAEMWFFQILNDLQY